MAYQSNPNTQKDYSSFSGALTAPTVTGLSTSGTVTTKTVTGWGAIGPTGPQCVPGERSPPPPGWRNYKLAGGAQTNESPLHGGPAYLASLCVESSCGMFHWRVYLAHRPETKFVYGAVAEVEGAVAMAVTTVMFLDPEEHEHFENWLADYESRFRSRQNLYNHRFPPPSGEPQTLMAMGRVHKEDQSVEVALWMSRQCAGAVYEAGPSMFLFENDGDAVAYKIKFS